MDVHGIRSISASSTSNPNRLRVVRFFIVNLLVFIVRNPKNGCAGSRASIFRQLHTPKTATWVIIFKYYYTCLDHYLHEAIDYASGASKINIVPKTAITP